MATKPAASRDEVYAFTEAAIAAGRPEAAGAAVICFEWLQRPENVLAGYVRWSDYRNPAAPDAIKIEHHKTGVKVLHPLVDPEDGGPLYPDAEAVLANVPRRGIPLILRPPWINPKTGELKRASEPQSAMQMAKIVRKICADAGLPKTFTLDACRHGRMTELEEAQLTDGQGRALSGHRSKAYERYGHQEAPGPRDRQYRRRTKWHAISEWYVEKLSERRPRRTKRHCVSCCESLWIAPWIATWRSGYAAVCKAGRFRSRISARSEK